MIGIKRSGIAAERTPLPPADVTSDGSTLSVVIPSPDGGGTQVFKGSSERDLISKLTFAQSNATHKIRELHGELKRVRASLSKLSTFIVALSKCRNSLSAEANEVLRQMTALIEQEGR